MNDWERWLASGEALAGCLANDTSFVGDAVEIQRAMRNAMRNEC
jgi:hypothetical protein